MAKIKRLPICERTRQAREHAEIQQKEMPALFKEHGVEITPDAYNKYETRSPLRQDLIPVFCLITGISEKWLLTGEGQMTSSLLEKIQALNADHLESIETIVDAYLQKQEV